MDPITQAALGATVGHAAFHRQLGMKAMTVGALAGMFPDIDSFYGATEGPFARLVSHRGVTHSVFFGPVAGAAAGWTWWRIRLARAGSGSPPEGTQAAWIGLFIVALFSHPLLDWFTTFGTQLFAPFSRTRYALDSIPIVDPLYTAMLVIGLLIARRLGGHRRAGWPTTIALVLSTAYLMLGLRINGLATLEAERQLAAAGETQFSVRAYPTMLQLPHRRIVATSAGEVRVGYLSMWRPCKIEWGSRPVLSSDNVKTLLATEEGGIFSWFTGGRLIGREFDDSGQQVVEMIDLRYGYTLDPLRGLWGMRARFDADGELIGRPERFNTRPPVSGEIIGLLLAAAFPESCATSQSLRWPE